jgi:hypothetical protein
VSDSGGGRSGTTVTEVAMKKKAAEAVAANKATEAAVKKKVVEAVAVKRPPRKWKPRRL